VPNVVRQVRGLHWLRFAFVSPNAFRDRSGERKVTKVVPRELRLTDVTIRYGGVQAVADLSVCAPAGRITSLIGPNGAGKTSVLDAITGFTRISTGQVFLDGIGIDRLTPHARARRGVGRSFQSLELFSDMTVLENLLAASEDRDWKSYLLAFILPARARLSSAGRAAVMEFGLDEVLDRLPGELPYGRQRMLAIARAVAAEPSVLLLDEPAAGLDEVEAREVAQLIRRLATDWGMAVLLIEHNMELVMSISDQVYAIDFGHLIAKGKPEEVRMNPNVLHAYLGEDLLAAEADRSDDGGDVAQKVSS
jgi:ABC-type branched-subunit amino acid transport system ATPase component